MKEKIQELINLLPNHSYLLIVVENGLQTHTIVFRKGLDEHKLVGILEDKKAEILEEIRKKKQGVRRDL